MHVTQIARSPARTGGARGRVLLVEDEEPSREAMRLVLEEAGFDVEVAVDGADAVALARAHMPEVVLMDLVLPGTDGFTAAKQIKRSELTAAIPVVAVTASWLGSDERRLRGLGFDAALRKPFAVSELIEQVTRLLPN